MSYPLYSSLEPTLEALIEQQFMSGGLACAELRHAQQMGDLQGFGSKLKKFAKKKPLML
jgi:hypothetical protein